MRKQANNLSKWRRTQTKIPTTISTFLNGAAMVIECSDIVTYCRDFALWSNTGRLGFSNVQRCWHVAAYVPWHCSRLLPRSHFPDVHLWKETQKHSPQLTNLSANTSASSARPYPAGPALHQRDSDEGARMPSVSTQPCFTDTETNSKWLATIALRHLSSSDSLKRCSLSKELSYKTLRGSQKANLLCSARASSTKLTKTKLARWASNMMIDSPRRLRRNKADWRRLQVRKSPSNNSAKKRSFLLNTFNKQFLKCGCQFELDEEHSVQSSLARTRAESSLRGRRKTDVRLCHRQWKRAGCCYLRQAPISMSLWIWVGMQAHDYGPGRKTLSHAFRSLRAQIYTTFFFLFSKKKCKGNTTAFTDLFLSTSRWVS